MSQPPTEFHPEFESVLNRIVSSRRSFPRSGAMLVGMSGIDGSGKSTWTSRLNERLSRDGWNVATIAIDAWHHPPAVRFSESDPGSHFYENAFRWDEMFDRLIIPLHRDRSITLTTNLNRQPGDVVYEHVYNYKDIDIILFEGIFIFRKYYRNLFDLTFWIDCSFETAMERAIARNQEGLSQAEIVRDYNKIYFPAQRLHFEHDEPKAFADVLIVNDERLANEVSRVS